jgi:hypothetical protein
LENKKAPIEGVCALPAEVLPYRLPTEADGLTKNSLVITELLASHYLLDNKFSFPNQNQDSRKHLSKNKTKDLKLFVV